MKSKENFNRKEPFVTQKFKPKTQQLLAVRLKLLTPKLMAGYEALQSLLQPVMLNPIKMLIRDLQAAVLVTQA